MLAFKGLELANQSLNRKRSVPGFRLRCSASRAGAMVLNNDKIEKFCYW